MKAEQPMINPMAETLGNIIVSGVGEAIKNFVQSKEFNSIVGAQVTKHFTKSRVASFSKLRQKDDPFCIKGDSGAGKLLDVSSAVMKQRRHLGRYVCGVDYIKRGKTIYWNIETIEKEG